MTEEESSSEKSAYEKWVEEINKYDSLHKYAKKKKKEEDESEDSE